MLALAVSGVNLLNGQTFLDPGFESYAVSPGGFVQPASGAWLFANDAGVVEPFAPNSSTGLLNTWSATFAPVQGEQYASTYAAADSLQQSVVFGAAGDYRLSVNAAAPDGSVTIPPLGAFQLGDGRFTFTLGNTAIGSPHTVTAGSGWSLFTADFTIPIPGSYQLGVRNTATSPYFINYDAFEVQPVPEPSTVALGLLGAFGLAISGRCWTRGNASQRC
jgi:hypothetical protein